MSQINPWKNNLRISGLKSTLTRDEPSTKNSPPTRKISENVTRNTSDNLKYFCHVKYDPKFKKWQSMHVKELQKIYEFFITELKKIKYLSIKEIQEKIPQSSLNFFIYKHYE